MISVHAQLLPSESLLLPKRLGDCLELPLRYGAEPPKEPFAPLGSQGGWGDARGGTGRPRRGRIATAFWWVHASWYNAGSDVLARNSAAR